MSPHYSNLSKRSIIPLHPSLQNKPPKGPQEAIELPDLHNVQGDICFTFPKDAEQFAFFHIKDAAAFKKGLGSFLPTSCFAVTEILDKIDHAKQTARSCGEPISRIETKLSQIAFSPSDAEHCKGVVESIEKVTFNSSITILHLEVGNVLPDRKEHFGYCDGISQPAIRGCTVPHPGRTVVDPGVLILGYPGDPVDVDKRPAWAKGGSMMVFRKLEQDVPGFIQNVVSHGDEWRKVIPDANLTHEQGIAWYGARLFGRWRSGAPIQLAPIHDDPELAEDDQRNNDFDFTIPGEPGPSDRYCPFNAHIRKTAPRNLDPYKPTREELAASSILRAGIPYGPPVNHQQPHNPLPNVERGLLFVCYQSSIEGGFLLQTQWALDRDFPKFGDTVGGPQPGQDPILGEAPSRSSDIRPRSYVRSRGGEYFFVPSISTLKTWASAK
ncbi:hypothetical protein H0H81_009877 [Sphagnurus paluster]|uniref:DyP dimeric alpha+beta barrel domain-containing protein n=1 Tax=Sphagnurus paluster TaxID=117069 RepID=A0A9P7K3X1_9AGAR|nr:hypothetical protein H0H81_009877 [Sphagnurus paluster]